MVASLLGILWLAVRSARVVFAILVTTVIGLIMTAALGLLTTGRFNLISVGSIPLFVGLGIDFKHPAQRAVPGRAVLASGARGRSGRGRPWRGASAGAGCRGHRRGLFSRFCRPAISAWPNSGPLPARHGHRFRLEHHLAAGIAQPAAPAGRRAWPRSDIPAWRPSRRSSAETGGQSWRSGFWWRSYPARCFRSCVSTSIPAPQECEGESMATLRDLTSDPDWTPNTINVFAPSLASSEPIVRRLAVCLRCRASSRSKASCPSNKRRSSRLFTTRRHGLIPFFG